MAEIVYKNVLMEPLEEDELEFLKRKQQRDDKTYKVVYALLMLLMVLISFFNGWYSVEIVAGEKEWFFSLKRFGIGLAILLVMANVLALAVYKVMTSKLKKDVASKYKIVEPTLIKQKKFMLSSNTYYFYLDSSVKYSIEVQEADFQRYEVGDEVNIEFTPNARIYLDYF